MKSFSIVWMRFKCPLDTNLLIGNVDLIQLIFFNLIVVVLPWVSNFSVLDSGVLNLFSFEDLIVFFKLGFFNIICFLSKLWFCFRSKLLNGLDYLCNVCSYYFGYLYYFNKSGIINLEGIKTFSDFNFSIFLIIWIANYFSSLGVKPGLILESKPIID